ncbi:MAG: ornithine cyclodeaminase family protein [Planctomycetota bacterium]|nr:ornithine cyclodeaminase family protein [Planctomycetota bacterium]
MSVLFLTESDVESLIDMPSSIEVVERAFVALADGSAVNVPRARARAPGFLLHSMSASAEYLGVAGWKNYTTTTEGARFHVALYDLHSGRMLALIQTNRLGQLRTGAASGVATRHLARPDAISMGLLGTGWQAESQLEAVACVRRLETVRVYSRNPERRQLFAEKMGQRLGLDIQAVDSADAAVQNIDIVSTATTAHEPLFDGRLLAAGSPLNIIGSNHLSKSESDVESIAAASTVACDRTDQCRLEAGELVDAVAAGRWNWDQAIELANIVAGTHAGRSDDTDRTVFKSVGLAIEDVAMAAELITRARDRGLGLPIPLDVD